jgi:hypothetical protein
MLESYQAILDTLKDGALTTSELAKATRADIGNTSKRLAKMALKGLVTKGGTGNRRQWAVCTYRNQSQATNSFSVTDMEGNPLRFDILPKSRRVRYAKVCQAEATLCQ